MLFLFYHMPNSTIYNPMKQKLIKVPPSKTLASIGGSGYVVLSDGQVARLLKPVVVNEKRYYNVVIDGTLRRIAGHKLLDAANKV